MKPSANTFAQPHELNITWPDLQLPPLKTTKTGEMVMGEEHAQAMVQWTKQVQQVVQQKLTQISGQVTANQANTTAIQTQVTNLAKSKTG